MQGKGEFRHADGHTLKGYFANNLYSHTYNGKKYFLNPLDNKADHQKYIENCINSIAYNKKQAEKKKEIISVIKASSINQLQEALHSTKQSGRTPLILASEESQLTTKVIFEALNTDGMNINPIFLRDLSLEVEKVPFDDRQKFIEQKYKYGQDKLHKMIVGEEEGQILLNFDEFKDECEVIGDVEQAAK